MSPAAVSVERIAPAVFLVRIAGAGEHEVTADVSVVERLAREGETAEELIARSFGFLLEREPASSILRRFRLEVIGDYFPEYWAVMRG